MKNIIVTAILLVFGQLVFGQTKVQKIDSLLTASFNKGEINGNVLIAEKGKVLYKKVSASQMKKPNKN